MAGITTVGLDADDTLWQNERFFKLSEAQFLGLLKDHAEGPDLSARLFEAERRNLSIYGFGIKGFTLSMLETATEVCGDSLAPSVVREILNLGRDMLAHPVETLPDVAETLAILAKTRRLVLVTKGDLFDQERKLAASELGYLFSGVEIVSDKTPVIYARVFSRYGDGPEHSVMVGNSMKSDILPALAAGAAAVHVPHELIWAYEEAEAPVDHPRFRRLETLAGLPALLETL